MQIPNRFVKRSVPFVLPVVALLAIFAASCTSMAGDGNSSASASGKKDVVDTAVAAGKFNTLVAAVKAAGLVETLKGAGPFTVFAPTDDAFAKLPAGTVEELLKPENKQKLVAILTYHVVPAKAMAADVASMSSAKTVNGKELKLKADGGKVMVDNATVTTADIECSNGVIHVIDTVLMP
jgi:transforming growth factor-beta-induced protein